jgi:hypothetical protein
VERLEIVRWSEILGFRRACVTSPPRPNAPIGVETIGETLIGQPLNLESPTTANMEN